MVLTTSRKKPITSFINSLINTSYKLLRELTRLYTKTVRKRNFGTNN